MCTIKTILTTAIFLICIMLMRTISSILTTVIFPICIMLMRTISDIFTLLELVILGSLLVLDLISVRSY
jgi:uncharacterized membrane protein YfhO